MLKAKGIENHLYVLKKPKKKMKENPCSITSVSIHTQKLEFGNIPP